MIQSYIFFIILFLIIFILYKFYNIIFSKIQYLMGYVMFGIGILTIISPVIMNNLDIIDNKEIFKKLLQKKYTSKL